MATDERGSLLQRHLLLAAALCDPRTSKGDCQVLAVISAHADRDTGEAWPGVNRIAKRAGIHRSTVLTSIGRLQGWGYVQVHRERGRANVYRLATGSAQPTSTPPELVAPTRPVNGEDQSRDHDPTGRADATGLVAPTRPDQSRPRYPNSAFDLSSSTQKKNSVACGASLEDEEQERSAEEARAKNEQRASLLTEYLDCRESHPKHAAAMLKDFPFLTEMIAAGASGAAAPPMSA